MKIGLSLRHKTKKYAMRLNSIKQIPALALALLVNAGNATAQEKFPYQNPELSPLERAQDLCSRLTLEEKAILMLDQSQGIDRLGIKPFYWWSEALHGVANQNDITVYPEPIGMAASFNDELVYKVFSATSDEMRATYHENRRNNVPDRRFLGLSVWTPNVNIFRDPRWGRGQETYGEDPFLTSRMGVAVVKGLQGPEDAKYRKLLACAKHFAVHSGPESSRHTDNITNVDPRDLFETYLPAFKATVQEGQVREVMCAYQRLEDEPCCGSNRLLQQILRNDWGFKYLIVSDCSAISDFWQTHKSSSDERHAAAVGVLAGTDVECGYDYAYEAVPEAVKNHLISEEEVDKRIVKLLEGRFSLGEMDDPELVEWSKIPFSEVSCKEHRALAVEMGRQAMTLLQNNNNTLPLSKKDKIALVGPNADNQVMLWGNYNGTPKYSKSILKAIEEKIGKSRVVHMQGCDYVDNKVVTSLYSQCSIDGSTGLKGTFWNNTRRQGNPVATLQVTKPLNVSTFGNYPFAPGVNLTEFSAYYETYFRPTKTQTVVIQYNGCSNYQIAVNGKVLYRNNTWRNDKKNIYLDVEAGKEYHIELSYAHIPTYNANLYFNIGTEKEIDYQEIINRLKGIGTVVFAGGIAPSLEGEEMPVEIEGFAGGDRTSIEMPKVQREFLKALKEAGKKVILVNCSGSAIALEPETEYCDAILQAWYAGQEGGIPIADVLFGDYNPGGKLPVTFYRNDAQLPDFKDYSMRGRTYRYFNGEPLFAFGYGLSYTTFQIGNATFDRKSITDNQSLTITVPVTNTGKRAGAEVVQIYIKRTADQDGPIRSLKAFKRVELKAGETKNVEITLQPDAFETFAPEVNNLAVMPGEYQIFYGNSSRDCDLQKEVITVTE